MVLNGKSCPPDWQVEMKSLVSLGLEKSEWSFSTRQGRCLSAWGTLCREHCGIPEPQGPVSCLCGWPLRLHHLLSGWHKAATQRTMWSTLTAFKLGENCHKFRPAAEIKHSLRSPQTVCVIFVRTHAEKGQLSNFLSFICVCLPHWNSWHPVPSPYLCTGDRHQK